MRESNFEASGEIIGRHCILELYQCDPCKLNDEPYIRTTLSSASKVAGAKLLNMITHRFQPQGITGLALLAESHISIHTWPESQYAAIDVFTCGHKMLPEKACEFLSREFDSTTHSLKSFDRETSIKTDHLNRKF
ncbi:MULTISPECIES: adenosylmethionine decarboxylase [unclassified Prochlorococcus]|uniref:adenosylmethionine decarboxylase n=1 Tax=unclassified Prochlorococcus TaxID=2627481 RepID=UPI00315D5E52